MSIKRNDGTIVHMPFPGHRTVAEVWEKEARHEILRTITYNGRRKQPSRG